MDLEQLCCGRCAPPFHKTFRARRQLDRQSNIKQGKPAGHERRGTFTRCVSTRPQQGNTRRARGSGRKREPNDPGHKGRGPFVHCLFSRSPAGKNERDARGETVVTDKVGCFVLFLTSSLEVRIYTASSLASLRSNAHKAWTPPAARPPQCTASAGLCRTGRPCPRPRCGRSGTAG